MFLCLPIGRPRSLNLKIEKATQHEGSGSLSRVASYSILYTSPFYNEAQEGRDMPVNLFMLISLVVFYLLLRVLNRGLYKFGLEMVAFCADYLSSFLWGPIQQDVLRSEF